MLQACSLLCLVLHLRLQTLNLHFHIRYVVDLLLKVLQLSA